MSKDVVGTQMTSQYSAYDLHAGYARLHARTLMQTHTRQGKRTYAHSHKFAIFIAFPWQQCFANEPQFLVMRTLRVFVFNRTRWTILGGKRYQADGPLLHLLSTATRCYNDDDMCRQMP